jgi:hypothetical protein
MAYKWAPILDENNKAVDASINKFIYLSILGDKNITPNASTADRPCQSCGIVSGDVGGNVGNPYPYYIFSSGAHTGSMSLYAAQGCTIFMYGQGINNTIFNKKFSLTGGNEWGNGAYRIFDITFADNVTRSGAGFNFYRCAFKYNIGTTNAYNSKFYVNAYVTGSAISYISVDPISVSLSGIQNILYDKCKVAISSQNDVNLSRDRYAAFNDCKFMIGSETEYTALAGNTADDLRASFVARCTAAGYTVPPVTEFGQTNLLAGRWIFSNNSAIDGLVLKGSEIHAFEITRLFYFGCSPDRNDSIPITTDPTVPGSFSSVGADSNIDVKENSIQLQPTVDISQKFELKAESNIIWLGGIKWLDRFDIIHNLPKEYGVFLDSTNTLAANPSTFIDVGKTYLLRSADSNEAMIAYNGKNYSSALASMNNIIIGAAATSFTPVTGSPVVYEVLDNKALHQTIQIRVVDALPPALITAGTALKNNYWYLVEHNTDQTNTTDYVAYNGKNYPVTGSFKASGTGSFTVSGNVHLRECWDDNYVYGSNSIFNGHNQPTWSDILPEYPQCLMRNNNMLENEMQWDAARNTYITSGHPEFYGLVTGDGGIMTPKHQMRAAYIQVRTIITTRNPMTAVA